MTETMVPAAGADDEPLQTGLLVLHGNRLEDLAAAVTGWLGRHPLAPLEEETLLVQSNGMAEWLKMTLAGAHGICAASRVELPARFLWRSYRAVLGRDAVPPQSPLDKQPLVWRLMSLLPQLQHEPVFAPVAAFLGHDAGADAARRLQLATRLADLFDQYQVYRSDWLDDWARGDDVLRPAVGPALPVPEDQAWQPALWRALLATLDDAGRAAARPLLHRRYLAALEAPDARFAQRVPRRLVLFGTTHVPQPMLQALSALARHSQVLLAVPNPCRYHWADLIEGRELLRAARHRHAWRGGRDLAALPLAQLHAQGHPLLAAWGRQSRDFVRQLDAFDDAEAARSRFALPRIDLFDEGGTGAGDEPPAPLLQQVQARIRDLVPLSEHAELAPVTPAADDRSIVFHLAHSAQREVEILHDQLLELLARPPGGLAVAPREIVVMVPDIDAFAPAIRSVFGQHGRGDARYIPWGIADLRERRHNPLLVTLESLLRAPSQRFTATELLGLLEVPAVARRHRLHDDDLPLLSGWIAHAGVRWGLDEAQRAALGLEACGDTNSWAFGLRRMLLGYATGDLPAERGGFAGIEPCGVVSGLSADLVGMLAELLETLQDWWRDAASPRTPADWGERLRALLPRLFEAADDVERATLAALDDALAGWLQACEAAAFDEPVGLAVVREAWLEAVDEPGLSQRFRSGGVTFCTLLPLRAIPFEVVCLLGMNDGDYPRRSPRSDFDLMGLPRLARPGDRSRRDDDRQLMLDALLSARRVLYLSWAGRSQRDNQPQPPSVLVAQLRDYLVAGWGPGVLDARTTEHPLQPFSRAYFDADGGRGLFTYASEWRAAHAAPAASDRAMAAPPSANDAGDEQVLTIDELARFLRNPVKAFFRRRLQVVFDEPEASAEDDEPFESGGLERWQQIDDVLHEARRAGDGDASPLDARVAAQVARLAREGRLPLAAPGRAANERLRRTLQPMLVQWHEALQALPRPVDKRPLRLADRTLPNLRLEQWLDGLRAAAANDEPATWLDLRAGKLAGKSTAKAPPKPRADKLVQPWLLLLAAAADGEPIRIVLIGSDVRLQLRLADAADSARATLLGLMAAWRDQQQADAPLPTAVLTGLRWLDDPTKAKAAYQSARGARGEGAEDCLARLYPDYESLAGDPGFEAATHRLYDAFRDWLAGDGVQLTVLPDALDGEDDDGDD
ncbi:exodeoxyribonuclease V subunit gamma [Aquabacterium humicola]|uniref:exodeoxyribonuclease V subunit gamma n=1 Tax=Aquabacterium humicola TaxID=3237377 RepID=UPI0025428C64|nr:exodeoxyribonuclease V subunit gamma [Rubrivivax pictus]